MQPEIRPATQADLPLVFDLVERLYAELDDGSGELDAIERAPMEAAITAEGERFLALLATSAAGSALGVLTLSEPFALYAGGRFGVIDELYVVPEARSSRVGAKLVDAAAAHGRARGWRRMDVTAPPGAAWSRSVAFYEGRGFVHTGPKLRLDLT